MDDFDMELNFPVQLDNNYIKKIIEDGYSLYKIKYKDLFQYCKYRYSIFKDNYSIVEVLSAIKDKMLYSSDYYFFKKDGIILGICCIDNFYKLEPYIWDVGILEKHRRNGYSNKLLSLIINELNKSNNINKLILNVDAENNIAIHLYENFGFKKINNY